uniref:Nectin-4-like n=1 Tax=Gouania willdenowi TaxID=441366 RepID=A0A8C5H9Z8_GOUWI
SFVRTGTRADFVGPSSEKLIRSLSEDETILPCRYQPSEKGQVNVQVTWYKEKLDQSKEQIITAHHISGQTAFGSWSGRVRFKGSDPTIDSSLVIMNTEVSDEGDYICHVSTFPSGNFDREIKLIVWTYPISSLDPVILEEGQTYRQAAACRSVARPPPHLTWDTDLNGQAINRSSDNGAVSSHYSLHPLRNMNGKKLDCLVWHPTFAGPRRLQNNVVVHYPPHAEVTGYTNDWYVGSENAALRCESGGNPKPHSFTWIRKGEDLPKGVISLKNGTLSFRRPLNVSDAGIYQCIATNIVGVGKADIEISLKEPPEKLENLLIIIVGGLAGGLLILMLIIVITVMCHHRRKNRKLKRELTQKKYQAHCRDSPSTISNGRGGGGGGGALDYLGRPVLYNNTSRRGETESGPWIERKKTGSDRKLVSHPPLVPSAFPLVHSTEIVRQLNGSIITPTESSSGPGSVAKVHQLPPVSCAYPTVTDDEDEVDEGLGGPASQEHPDDQDSETNSSQVSEALSAHFQQSNGTMRPKNLTSPHASMIHKAQIV